MRHRRSAVHTSTEARATADRNPSRSGSEPRPGAAAAKTRSPVDHATGDMDTRLEPLGCDDGQYAVQPFGGPEQVLKYLTGYTHRVALSNRRLVKLADGRVTFTWKDYADGCRRKEMTLDAMEFVRRFALHIIPKRLVRIRRYGLLAHRDRGERLALCRSLLGAGAGRHRPQHIRHRRRLPGADRHTVTSRPTGQDQRRCWWGPSRYRRLGWVSASWRFWFRWSLHRGRWPRWPGGFLYRQLRFGLKIAARHVAWVVFKRPGTPSALGGWNANAFAFWTVHDLDEDDTRVAVRSRPAPTGIGRLRAGPANEGPEPVAVNPHDRLKFGGRYISHCFLRCITGCHSPLVHSGRSLGWWHLLRLRYNPPSENRARPLGLGECTGLVDAPAGFVQRPAIPPRSGRAGCRRNNRGGIPG